MAGDLVVGGLVNALIWALNDRSITREKKCKHIIGEIKLLFSTVHTESELDLALSILFRPDNSLLYFIRKGFTDKSIKAAIKEALCVPNVLLEKYTTELAPYIVPIKDVCYQCIVHTCSAEVQEKAYQVIKAIVRYKKSPQADMDLKIPLLVEFLHTRALTDRTLTPTVVQGVYEVYGAVVEHYPQFCHTKVDSLMRNILKELNYQMRKSKDIKPAIICGCMRALTGILLKFSHDHKEKPSQSEQIYSYVKDASAFQEDAGRRVYQRAALEVFSTHVDQLWEWVVRKKDYKFWLRELAIWASRNTSDDRKAGNNALKAFNCQAWAYLRKNPNNTDMLMVFLHHYRDILTNPQAATSDTMMAVEGFSALACVCKELVNQGDTVPFMFRVILQRAQTNFMHEDGSETESNGEMMAKYLESLSNICAGLGMVSGDQLSALTRLARLVIEQYPHHHTPAQGTILYSLVHTVLNMSLCEPIMLDRFLYPVVYQGIIITCGHSLEEEAELQKELTGREVITYKSYVKLWKGLLGIAYEEKSKKTDITPDLRRYVTAKLYDCLIKALIALVDKLNVGYKKEDSEELELHRDPESCVKGVVPQDHRVLCNLANLYKELLTTLKAESLVKWLPDLTTMMVNRSVSFPLVSAFYKLIAVVLSVAQKADYFLDESEDRQSLGTYIVGYLEDVMIHCKQYKNDLQVACLLAIISVPVPLIQPLLARIPSVMQIVFQLGQTFLLLAEQGMAALECWQQKLSAEQLKPILTHVLPSFDPYLRSGGITTELPEDESMPMSKRQQKREKRIAEATQLSQLQHRMLGLLSRLDSATRISMLRPPNEVVSWTSGAVLNLSLPLPHLRPTVSLDPMLPRVIELALTCSDRQTKAAACEVLQAFVIIFIGNSRELSPSMVDDLVKILPRLMSTQLRLASGPDPVARQLFHLLTLQLMHWFSSPRMLVSEKILGGPVQTQAVLQAVWDGITDEKDMAVQDFSALCLREFVEWCIKQSSDEQLALSPVNIKAVLRQINTYCVHPSLNKRVGAALVFNHIASLLWKETTLVDQFWLQLLYHLVLNLDLGGDCDNHPACSSLDSLLKVIQKNADLFNKESASRQVPAALGSGLLRDVLRFLLQKCGSKTAACAAKCRELVVAIRPLIPELSDVGELEDLIAACEGGGNGLVLPIQPSSSDTEHLRASLDCYAWCIKQGLISPMVAIKPPSRLVSCVEYFINLLDVTAPPQVWWSRQESTRTRTKCEVVLSLFQLLGLLDSAIKELPYTFWGHKFWKLVAM